MNTTVVIPGIQTGKSVWYGPELIKKESEWLFTLNSLELKELENSADLLASAESKDENSLALDLLEDFDNNFNLPHIKSKMAGFLEQLHEGIGFLVWRGIPVREWSHRRVAAAFLLIGKCFGNLRQQNAKGHVLGHVTDLGLSVSDPNVRFYQTSERLHFHADYCDVVGLLCLKTAKCGGLSSLVSTSTIYNELLTSDPQLVPALFDPIPRDKRGEVAEGTLPYSNIPVYNYYDGFLSSVYVRHYIDSAQRFPDAPRLTNTQIAALDRFDSLANDSRLNLQMELLPGDMQFVHNHSILHSRTGYDDWGESERKRHLLRMWIATEGGRPLPPVIAQLFGSVTVGQRGGVNLPGVESIAPLNP